jgi:hypothetical protein
LAVALTPGGDVLVVDYAKQSIREFDSHGGLIQEIGTPGQFGGDLHALAVDQVTGEIYALASPCVFSFKPNGTQDGAPACVPDAPDSVARPQLTAISAGPGGTIVARQSGPFGTEIVDEFGPDHELSQSWTVPAGNGDGVLPGLPFAVDANGDVYLPGEDSVHEFDSDGTLISQPYVPLDLAALEIHGSTLYVESVNGSGDEITPLDLAGNVTGQAVQIPDIVWSGPAGTGGTVTTTPTFAVDAAGITAVTGDHHVEQVGFDGTVNDEWGGLPADVFSPWGAFEDAAGDIYVLDLDYAGARVIEYDANGDPPVVLADLSSYISGAAPREGAAMNSQGDLAIDYWGKVVTLSPTGAVLSVVNLDCQDCYGPIALAPDGDIYAVDFRTVDKFSSAGALLATWPIESNYVATDPAGNVYLEQVNGWIGKYSPSGQLLTTFDPNGFEPTSVQSLAVGANGDLYADGNDGVRIYGPSGTVVAVWPYANASNGIISVAPDGDVLVTGQPPFPESAVGQVSHYYDLMDPLPAVPAPDESPWAAAMKLALSSTRQPSDQAVSTKIGCSGPAGPTPLGATCTGTLSLTTSETESDLTARDRRASVRLGHARFKVAVRKHGKVTVNLGQLARKLLGKRSLVRATLTARFRTGAKWTTVTKKISLHQRRRVRRTRPRHRRR